MKIDMTKKYRTRGGFEVKLLSDQGSDAYPLVGMISGTATPNCWLSNGRFSPYETSHHYDLIEVKEKKTTTGWVNIYSHGMVILHRSKNEADDQRGKLCLACKEITIEYFEGEGL